MTSARTRLGSERGFMVNRSLFLGKDAVEIDEAEGYDVFVRRVLFSDVELITLHRYQSWRAFVLLVAVGLVALPTLLWTEGGVRVGFALGALLLALPIFLYLRAGGSSVVTVFGRRSRARIVFAFRKQRAQEVLRLLVETVGQGQRAPEPGPATGR